MDEQLITDADRLLCWRGPKMGMTVLNAKPGRLVLTDRRLLFFSAKGTAGSNGVPPMNGASGSRPLDEAGSLEIPLSAVTSLRAASDPPPSEPSDPSSRSTTQATTPITTSTASTAARMPSRRFRRTSLLIPSPAPRAAPVGS